MKSFTKLRRLFMQLKVLLGRPEDGLRLKDVLAPRIESFSALLLPDYNRQEDHEQGEHYRIWEVLGYSPKELRAAIEHDGRLASLQKVDTFLTREAFGYYFNRYWSSGRPRMI
ncbi:uncharacterized protein BDV17DRAFT_253559 [Aspergillus undulatus]|uniref:uncharacterized protein n=1 Tax=Aspergillus undulatus TaxID=1810928 RepID=UPI003CCCA4BD